MSLFQRIKRLLKANLNDIISRAEEPEKILNQVIVDMREQLHLARKQVAMSNADEKRLKKQLAELLKQSDVWEEKAIRAIQLEDDELAKEALARKARLDQQITDLQEQWELQRESVELLKAELDALAEKIEEAERQKNLLLARKKRAEAQKMIQATLSGISEDSALRTLSRMEQKIEQIEAEAESYTEMNQESKERNFDRRLKALEVDGSEQDDALAALKARLGVKKKGGEEKEKEKEHLREELLVPREDESW